ncbi:lysine exporter protein [Corynebacterium kutscheri]|uniref:L-lysine exporter n=1 Tax=Corynebacterium kutscheri TaxID=35755 RepID=A0A0F6R010_9CORY|nr:L-lysine exporter [Corynebacterium kutscheri]AKE41025.1 L-lysine exporter [Corynebacterium kutscheri]VEH06915.1 lysine exporter protein [Corynebacterium kutscheri]VEH09323.1 lysine exporter protein [Corynebacterium kutscheri]VEH79411.1 lysine exporter protein [Corynebacterium kutscheri]
MSIALSGFLVGLSLIVAIGPQNALIIRQGIKREGIIAVILVCLISDIILIFGGTLGVGALVEQAPIALTILKWCGVAYLAWFAFHCFKDAFKKDVESITIDSVSPQSTAFDSNQATSLAPVTTTTRPVTYTSPQTRSWVKPMLAALAFTWLNPAAYIDVLVMLGGIANQHGPDGRWVFAAGALAASFLWFPSLGFGAVYFSNVLSKPKSWRIINFCVGIIMIIMCLRLLMH